MEMTTLPASCSGGAAPSSTPLSHGVATTTTSASAAPAFVVTDHGEAPVGPCRHQLGGDPLGARRLPRTERRPAARPRPCDSRGPGPAGPVPPRIPTCMAIPLHSRTMASGPTGGRWPPKARYRPVTSRRMGMLDGKRLLITGVLTEDSLAFGVARLALEEGAESSCRGRAGRCRSPSGWPGKLPGTPDVLEIDVTVPEQLAAAAAELSTRWDRLDGLLHAIGYAPARGLGQGMFGAGWEQVATALHISAYSLKALVEHFRPLLEAAGRAGGASVVGLDFDATVAWPVYDWMGVAKAALESLTRYLARDLGPEGIRVNLVAAGPVRTMAAKSIPGFGAFEDTWDERAPLGWDVHDTEAVAKACVALFSDWFPMTTGEMLHVDGGAHAIGA